MADTTSSIELGFIGFGNMAQAMAQGLVDSGALSGEHIHACAGRFDKLQATAEKLGVNAYREAAEDGRDPLLGDFHRILKGQPEPEARDIALRYERYVKGALSFFNHQSNVGFENRITNVDFKDLSQNMRVFGMLTALEAVPAEYEDASLALGATPIETYFRVSVPAAKSGIAAAVVLGVGRSIGEAMAVMMVSGNATSRMPSLFESVRFLTTAVASEMSYSSGLQQQALFSIALVLFLFIMLINAGLNLLLKRNKEG